MAKSEKVPNITTDKDVVGLEYSNGAQHWYGVDAEGKKTHISENDMLEKFGYGPEDFQGKPPTDGTEIIPEPPLGPDDDPENRRLRPGRIGSVKIRRGSTPHIEIGTGGEDDDDDFEKDRTIGALQSDILFMIDCAAEFEVGGNDESLKQAQERFIEMFDNLAELSGWSKSERNKRFNLFIDVFKVVVEGRMKDKDQDEDDDDDKPKDEVVSIAERESLAKLSGELDAVRKRLAELNVKASGRIFVGRSLKAELEATRNEWYRLQVLVGAETMRQVMLLDEGDADGIDKRLAGFAQAGASLEASKLAELQANTPVKGFLNWYAKKYNSADKRWKKALLIAPAGLVAGVTAGTIIGAVGGGIMAGLIARGAVKGALSAKMQALRGRVSGDVNMGNLTPELEDLDDAQAAQLLALRSANANWTSTTKFVGENTRENKKRAGKAMAIGAVVGAASGIVANWATDQDWFRGSGVAGKITHKDPFGGQHHPGPKGGVLPPEAAPVPANPNSFLGFKVIDGKPFISDVRAAGIAPPGMEQEMVNYLQSHGTSNGYEFTGWLNGRMFHTEDGFSHIRPEGWRLIKEFWASKGLEVPSGLEESLTITT